MAINVERTHAAGKSGGRPLFRRRIVFGVIAAAIVATVAFAIASPNLGEARDAAMAAGSSGSDAPLPVRVASIGSISPPISYRSYAGVLIARRESDLSFERGGRLIEINVEEGDAVRAGQIVARIDTEDLDAVARRLAAELAAAEAALSELVAGPRKETIAAARARVDRLAARRRLAVADRTRQQSLMRRGAGSEAASDSAVFGAGAAEAAVVAAEAELAELVAGTRVERLAAQRAVVESIRGQIAEIDARRNDSVIACPFDGIIASRRFDEGAVVPAGRAVLSLVSKSVEGRFGLPASRATRFPPGQPVTVELADQTVRGVVDRLEPIVEQPTRTRPVYVTIDRPSSERDRFGGWVPGAVVNLRSPHTDANVPDEGTAWVPTASLIRGGRGIWNLLVVVEHDGVATTEARAVTLLRTEGDYSLMRGMIRRGESLVIDGLHRITAGVRVRAEFGRGIPAALAARRADVSGKGMASGLSEAGSR